MTALALIPESSLALIKRVSDHAAQIGQVVDVCPLETPEADAKARALLRLIETLDGQADAERKALKAPHLERGREIDDAFKPARTSLERVGSILRRRLGEAAVRREADRTAALELAARAARVGDTETANAAIQVADPVHAPAAAGVSDRMTWEATGFDPKSMPVEFLTVDMVRIREHIREADRNGRPPGIPGVTFSRAATFSVRKIG